ncbi:hypothetical protein HGRIS_003082 [Hohenbuehelia grisea]|uniref:Uncharacterized protein n=1 Tax=Hohenbuehelia grisea TaxID=104357 RepID=A0ABR3JPI1_9AGAR
MKFSTSFIAFALCAIQLAYAAPAETKDALAQQKRCKDSTTYKTARDDAERIRAIADVAKHRLEALNAASARARADPNYVYVAHVSPYHLIAGAQKDWEAKDGAARTAEELAAAICRGEPDHDHGRRPDHHHGHGGRGGRGGDDDDDDDRRGRGRGPHHHGHGRVAATTALTGAVDVAVTAKIARAVDVGVAVTATIALVTDAVAIVIAALTIADTGTAVAATAAQSALAALKPGLLLVRPLMLRCAVLKLFALLPPRLALTPTTSTEASRPTMPSPEQRRHTELLTRRLRASAAREWLFMHGFSCVVFLV